MNQSNANHEVERIKYMTIIVSADMRIKVDNGKVQDGEHRGKAAITIDTGRALKKGGQKPVQEGKEDIEASK